MTHKKTYILMALAIFSVFSCKKTESPVEQPPDKVETTLAKTDSLSFEVNGKQYVFNKTFGWGGGNHQVNLKPYTEPIPDRKTAIETGGYYYYGEKDSTMYSAFYKYSPDDPTPAGRLEVAFSEKFANSTLESGGFKDYLFPKDLSTMIKTGKQLFAVDLDKENTMPGVSIEFYDRSLDRSLSTTIPGSSILVRSSLKKDIQDNSTFEIKKIEKLKNGSYLIEANFEVNFFDYEAHLYRAEKGFMRLTATLKPFTFFTIN